LAISASGSRFFAMNDREAWRSILRSAVDSFLEAFDDEFPSGEKDELGSVVIVAEIHSDYDGEPTSVPFYWSSNESRIFQRGMFETLCDYSRLESESLE
jgi:hypothetical protein